MSEIQTLKKSLSEISFCSREQINGKTVGNKCGRDFLYYALNYHQPGIFNSEYLNPREIDSRRLFGIPTTALFAWTQIQFIYLPKLLKKYDLRLIINEQYIFSYFSFVYSILFSRVSFQTALVFIEKAVDNNQTVGIDISLGLGGLLDHVLFVYGFDEENLYVFDTHKVMGLGYENNSENQHYFTLPKSVIKKRWTRFGRVWQVL